MRLVAVLLNFCLRANSSLSSSCYFDCWSVWLLLSSGAVCISSSVSACSASSTACFGFLLVADLVSGPTPCRASESSFRLSEPTPSKVVCPFLGLFFFLFVAVLNILVLRTEGNSW